MNYLSFSQADSWYIADPNTTPTKYAKKIDQMEGIE
jgi:hypothetical protein